MALRGSEHLEQMLGAEEHQLEDLSNQWRPLLHDLASKMTVLGLYNRVLTPPYSHGPASVM